MDGFGQSNNKNDQAPSTSGSTDASAPTNDQATSTPGSSRMANGSADDSRHALSVANNTQGNQLPEPTVTVRSLGDGKVEVEASYRRGTIDQRTNIEEYEEGRVKISGQDKNVEPYARAAMDAARASVDAPPSQLQPQGPTLQISPSKTDSTTPSQIEPSASTETGSHSDDKS